MIAPNDHQQLSITFRFTCALSSVLPHYLTDKKAAKVDEKKTAKMSLANAARLLKL